MADLVAMPRHPRANHGSYELQHVVTKQCQLRVRNQQFRLLDMAGAFGSGGQLVFGRADATGGCLADALAQQLVEMH